MTERNGMNSTSDNSNCFDKNRSAVGFFYDLFSSKFNLKNYRSNALYTLLCAFLIAHNDGNMKFWAF